MWFSWARRAVSFFREGSTEQQTKKWTKALSRIRLQGVLNMFCAICMTAIKQKKDDADSPWHLLNEPVDSERVYKGPVLQMNMLIFDP